jgi:hypothetical protein
MAYLTMDPEHTDDYNYLYTERKNNQLYILIDSCSDTTDDAFNREWVSLWITKENSTYHSFTNYTYANTFLPSAYNDLFEEINLNLNKSFSGDYYDLELGKGLEGIFYNVSTGDHFVDVAVPYQNSRLNSTANFTIQYGFNASVNSAIPHRIFEISIPLVDLNLSASEDYRLMVQGYGTSAAPAISQNVSSAGFYAFSPSSPGVCLTEMLMWFYYITNNNFDETGLNLVNLNTTGAAIWYFANNPRLYYPCGSSANVIDLKDNFAAFLLYNQTATSTTTSSSTTSSTTTSTTTLSTSSSTTSSGTSATTTNSSSNSTSTTTTADNGIPGYSLSIIGAVSMICIVIIISKKRIQI